MGFFDFLGAAAQANATKKAAQTAADAQIKTAEIAAETAKFKPWAITSGFGKSYFDTEGQTAGYEMDPRLRAMQERQYDLATQVGGQLNLDPKQAAQEYYNQQQELMRGGREAEDIALRQQLLRSGRIGYGVSPAALGLGSGTGGLVNDQMLSKDLARARADAELSAKSSDYAQAMIDKLIGREQGMLQFGLGLEELAMKPLTMGADIGNRAAIAGSNQAQALMTGGANAAQANLAGNLAQANMYGQLGKTLNNMDWSGMFGGGSPLYQYQMSNQFGNPAASMWSAQVGGGGE